MSSKFLIVTRYPTAQGAEAALIEALGGGEGRRLLKSISRPEVLELRALNERINLGELSAQSPSAWDPTLAPLLVGDVRREILEFVEAPKDCSDLVPATRYIQLRHVEVKPAMMAGYRAWREETIFDVVRSHPPAEVFLAYHSLVSGQPGVMFIAGFNTDVDSYRSAFESPRYQDIVRQAGDTYITGGTDGLYTEIYESVVAS